MERITYYHILGVSSDASDDEILAAFRRKVKEWHPDVCGHPDAEERMREINKAAEILCDPVHRRRYDRALAGRATFEKEQVPQARHATTENNRATGLSEALARMTSPLHKRVRPGTLRFVTVVCAPLVVIFGILVVVYLVYPLAAAIFPSTTGEMTGTALPGTSAGDRPVVTEHDGDDFLAEGNYSGALAAYDAVIAINPSVSERDLWYNRGMALQALGLYSEAAVSFDRALQTAPDDSFALAQKGAALIGLGRYNESLWYTDKALAKTPEIGWIWSNRGIALEHLGETGEARAAFEKAGIPGGIPGNALYRNVVISPDIVGNF